MKRTFFFIAVIISSVLIFTLFYEKPINNIQTENIDENFEQKDNNPVEMRACWFSYLEWQIIFKDKDENEFKDKAKEVLNNLINCGLNTLIIQTRAFGDALYKSELSPASKYFTSSICEELSYDPFEIITNFAFEYHILVHAWINPLRTMSDVDFVEIPDKYTIKKWYNSENWNDYYMKDLTGKYILIPANPEVRKFIVDIASELMIKYKIAGVHIDDYFYPSNIDQLEANDAQYYEKINTNVDITTWRRESTSNLVKELYSKCHEIDSNTKFGISPQANLKNNYDVMYIDVEQWLSNDGYVDYIMPQIYFGFENTYHPFEETAKQWNDITKNNTVLYAGLAVYKTGLENDSNAGAGATEWKNFKDILKRQEECLRQFKKYHGYCLYSYKSIYKPDGSKNPISQEEIDNLNSLFNI